MLLNQETLQGIRDGTVGRIRATAEFEVRIRRLKALGLGESLKIGYRLSPRGHVGREALSAGAGPSDSRS